MSKWASGEDSLLLGADSVRSGWVEGGSGGAGG